MVLPHPLAVPNLLVIPAITPSHSELTTPELEGGGGERTSSGWNMAVGLELSILAKACSLIWDWTIFINPFLDPIALTKEVRRCWSDGKRELGFLNFINATQPQITSMREVWHGQIIEQIRTILKNRIKKEQGKHIERMEGYSNDEDALRWEFGIDLEADELEAAGSLTDVARGHGRCPPQWDQGGNLGVSDDAALLREPVDTPFQVEETN
ncbi:hypothetical protein B9Z19DRAFT_1134999 [Tuber borchii]|uniref:Uncharacterized protein n=1 Tax=Tuber borchii TaxID=42251 RepID=A0A2T6ZDF9_TUBBO|nr:hypothetical protein B9Z19DRAFT_1134999 [Tuber borchii]